MEPLQTSHTDLPAPQSSGSLRPVRMRRKLSLRWLKAPILVLLCAVAGFAGSWAAIGSGFVTNGGSQTITESRERVLAEGEVVADVAKTVSPSVVSIVTESAATNGFFGTSQAGAGTGIILSKDGYILTNKHVIPEGVRSVSVVLEDGTIYDEVTVLGRDPINDLAFLKIKNVDNLTPAKIGDSSAAQVGQKVVAIGNALGQYQTTVTSGIISGVGRPVTASDGTSANTEQLENLIQTDAAINPGNSGGPLVDLNGEVVGINTAIAEDAQSIGFAIPINDAKGLIKGVLASGEVKRAYLGVRYVTITPESARQLKVEQKQGAYVGGSSANPIISGGPADKAGLRAGDVITRVNDVELTQRNTLLSQLSQFTPGETVAITYVRDGKTQTTNAQLQTLQP